MFFFYLFHLFSLVNIIMASGHKSGLTSGNGGNGQENWWVRVICGQKYVFYLEILFGGICIDMNYNILIELHYKYYLYIKFGICKTKCREYLFSS